MYIACNSIIFKIIFLKILMFIACQWLFCKKQLYRFQKKLQQLSEDPGAPLFDKFMNFRRWTLLYQIQLLGPFCFLAHCTILETQG